MSHNHTGLTVPPKNGLLGLIADYYTSRGDEERGHLVGKGTLEEAVRTLMLDLSNADSMAVSAGADAHRAILRAEQAEGDIESASQPLAPEMARLNARVIELTLIIDAAGMHRGGIVSDEPSDAAKAGISPMSAWPWKTSVGDADCTPAYAKWLKLGQNSELDHFAVTRVAFAAGYVARRAEMAPIDMVLHCPACGVQHIDHEEPGCRVVKRDFDSVEFAPWTNPPHRSHLCAGCGHVWRPADVPTNGVVETKTHGKDDHVLFVDTPIPQYEPNQSLLWTDDAPGYCRERDRCVCGGDVPAVRAGCANWVKGAGDADR